MTQPVLFVDADVIIAAAAAPREHSASHVVLLMGAMTLVDTVTSAQAMTEVERNIRQKLPDKLLQSRVVTRGLRVLPDPTAPDIVPYQGQADPKDLPLLVAALQHNCHFFLTFNVRHSTPNPGTITVLRPGDFVRRVRAQLPDSCLERRDAQTGR